MSPALGNLAFLLVAALAGVVAGVAAERRGRPGPECVALGSALFLLQFAVFILLAGLGAPAALAWGAALVLGVLGTLRA